MALPFILVEITLEADQKEAIISVIDKGSGIPEDKLKLIFSRFYRMEENGTRGFALGLFLCSEIVQRHGGKIWVEGEVGRGSTFRFSLPFKAE